MGLHGQGELGEVKPLIQVADFRVDGGQSLGVIPAIGFHCVGVLDYYETHGAAISLPMDGPWLHARLNKPDLFRYYEEYHPDIADHAKRAVYFPTTHFTVRDFIRAAASHGLEIVTYRRQIQKYYVKKFFYTDPSLRGLFF